MKEFRREVIRLLQVQLPEFSDEHIDQLLEMPKDTSKGDFAFPCFQLAKTYRKAPALLAAEIGSSLESSLFRIQVENAYINFTVDPQELVKKVLREIEKKGKDYGKSEIGQEKTVLIEYSSANISKELHIGHIRGIMIGISLSRIYKYLGYNVVTINHLGDYGINFGMMITAFLRWGDKEKIEREGVRGLLDLYVRFKTESEENPQLMEEARHWFRKLEEEKDPGALELWQWFKDISMKEYKRVYDRLGCHFDSYAGESFYSDRMPLVRRELKEKGLLVEDQGAEIVDLSLLEMPNAVITTSTGTSLYLTRDIAAALYRHKEYDFDTCLYVVGSEQKLHFQQLKAIVKLMGYDFGKNIEHIAHGLILTDAGKISSRGGERLFLEEFLDLAVEKTKAIIEEKNPTLEDKWKVAEEVGIGALAYNELSTSVTKDYTFDWDIALNFEGETSPYLQYANVRCQSVLEGNEVEGEVDYRLLTDEESVDVVRELAQFPQMVLQAQQRNEPAVISRYLMKLAKSFNRYYQNHTIRSEEEDIRLARMTLVKAISTTLVNGMELINMKAPRKM